MEGKDMKKKDLRTLSQKAQDYQCDLLTVLDNISLYYKVPKKYLDWSLRDCLEMVKFYALVYTGRNKAAYNMMHRDDNNIEKLMPQEIWNELSSMYQ